VNEEPPLDGAPVLAYDESNDEWRKNEMMRVSVKIETEGEDCHPLCPFLIRLVGNEDVMGRCCLFGFTQLGGFEEKTHMRWFRCQECIAQGVDVHVP
jgi:hypothetical protein